MPVIVTRPFRSGFSSPFVISVDNGQLLLSRSHPTFRGCQRRAASPLRPPQDALVVHGLKALSACLAQDAELTVRFATFAAQI